MATILDELVETVVVEEVPNTVDILIAMKEVLLNFVDEVVSEVVDEDVPLVGQQSRIGIYRILLNNSISLLPFHPLQSGEVVQVLCHHQ